MGYSSAFLGDTMNIYIYIIVIFHSSIISGIKGYIIINQNS